MKELRTFAFAAALLALICACSEKKTVDPYQEALTEALQKQHTGQFESVEFAACEKIDSSTFNDELLRRKKVFEVKAEQDETLYLKYVAEKKPKNAENQRTKMLEDKAVLVRLDSLAESFGPKAEDIAFYDFRFSVVAKCKNSIMKIEEGYACITPGYEVVGMTTKKRDIHKTTGKAIPGYLEIIKGGRED